MGKDKLKRWAEMEHFDRVFQPDFYDVFKDDYVLKGKWKNEVFKNNNPLVIELGCGRGEYTVGLATKFPDKNFIGIDIKGARLWRGAKTAHENNLVNAAFIRARIETITSFFAQGEVDEIWITFPDPQLKVRRWKKRLTSSGFLNNYKKFLADNGIIHLKTDSLELYEYTTELVKLNNLEVDFSSSDLYHSDIVDDILSIQTFYESQYINEGKPITYIKFKLNKSIINEPPHPEE